MEDGGDAMLGVGLVAHILGTVHVVDHTEYIIKVTYAGASWKVQRRYNLFHGLHSTMRKSAPTIVIPELPPRGFFGNLAPSLSLSAEAAAAIPLRLLQDPRFSSMHALHSFQRRKSTSATTLSVLPRSQSWLRPLRW